MRVIIAGSQMFEQYLLLKLKCNEILKNVDTEITIISGDAKGADKLGVKYAKEKGFKFKLYPAKWDDLNAIGAIIKTGQHGNYNAKAGIDRNLLMANNADALIAFWNGKSPGTKNMIDMATKKGLKVRVIKFA